MKKFRRGKKFQDAYFDIGKTNQQINSLQIEADSHERHSRIEELKSCIELISDLKKYLVDTYSDDGFDLDYTLPLTSGLYVKQSPKDILKK